MSWYQDFLPNYRAKHQSKNRDYYTHPASAFVEPFRIADGLWYVGDSHVCVHLIETREGLILLDSGYTQTNLLLTESIRRAGFDPADVRWILHTHEHFDHFGASETFQTRYGTKLDIGANAAASLRENPARASMDFSHTPFLTLPHFDYELQDNEEFTFGGVTIRCVPTPGHALGVLSFFFEVTDGGEKHLAGLFGGAGTTALLAEYLLSFGLPLDMPQRMLDSIDRVAGEPVTVHLGNHPRNNHTLEKRAQQLEHGGNPFVDAASWGTFLAELRATAEKIAEENAAKLRAHGQA